MGPDYPVERDFSPAYRPWDQRLCLVPDGDFFEAIRSGKVSVATGAVERFTEHGLQLATGEKVAANIVVTATGLVVKLLGGITVTVDGQQVNPTERLIYKGFMLQGVPNHFFTFGYTNASWTLRSDLTARTVCRLLNHMQARGETVCVPHPPAGMERHPLIDFSSGYVQRASAVLPSQGDRDPWQVRQNYIKDLAAMSFGRLDADLEFSRNGSAVRA